MARRRKRENIEPLLLRGSEELGQATGFFDPETHRSWRQRGLKYYVIGGDFAYLPADVENFIKKAFKAPPIFAEISPKNEQRCD